MSMNMDKPNLTGADSRSLAEEMVRILYQKSGIDIKLYTANEDVSLTDYHILVSGRSSTHVKSLADSLEFEMDERGVTKRSMEGRDAGAWILLDYYRVIVHVFDHESRAYYNLERLQNPDNLVDISALLVDPEA